MSEYFPETKSLGGKVKVQIRFVQKQICLEIEIDLSNYATKTNLTNTIVVDTLSFAKKVDLANFKSNVDK